MHRDDPRSGFRFIADELADAGHQVSERRVRKVCSQAGIVSAHSRKRGRSKKPGPPVHDDLVERNFTATGPDRLWLTDITDHPTGQGKLYLCPVQNQPTLKVICLIRGAAGKRLRPCLDWVHVVGGSARRPGSLPAMAFTASVLNVFIASPGDTSAYRDAVEASLHRWNGMRSANAGVVIIPRRWEADGIPLLGGDGQSQVNSQLVDKADIVVGIFHTRLGSETPRGQSGTAEEIERTHAAGKPVHVYHSTAPLPSDVDIKQVEDLREFLNEMRTEGLTGSFATAEDLQNQVQAAIEHDITSLELGVPIAPPREDPHAVLRVRYEEGSRTSNTLRVINVGTATARAVWIGLESTSAEYSAPSIWGNEIEPDILPQSDYAYSILTHSGTGISVRVNLRWTEDDGQTYTETQTVSFLG